MLILALLILVALAFDFMNGFHDAANSIATVVSTRVLTPRAAVAWAAFFNFVAAFGFGVAVATTIGKGIVNPEVMDRPLIFAGLAAAFTWDWITWRWGLPTSSSHALIGAFAGAALTKAGPGVLVWSGITRILIFIVVSPVAGLLLGAAFMFVMMHLLKSAHPAFVDRVFRRLQLLSAAGYSLGHGTNDAQKTMGIIAVLLFTSGHLGSTFYVPFWVILICHAAIGLGTLLGGWRIVHTMGMRLTALQPVGGFCAETAGAIALFGSATFGIPVSTTHTITGAIIGVGSMRRLSAVRWGVARNVVWAWVLTIPCSAAIAALIYLPFKLA
ncbi:MAG: inorganic phosphate transporter [Deltaproteobacteria bacterium]|nr:MAG: inorganic phosphate transporter [Deltaproteobacteria bacterium]TMA70705.1 MAG: inorganic phosphate transporter [Deltaproteobacteria bacterium]